jgi:hypothetical protein
MSRKSRILPRRSFCVKVKQITAPDLSGTDESYNLSISVPIPDGLNSQSTYPLTRRSRNCFPTKAVIVFPYSDISPNDCLDFTLLRSAPQQSEDLALLKLPIEWFPADCKVRECFHMEPLVELDVLPMIFLEVHNNYSETVKMWEAPYGVISPREAPVRFAVKNRGLEFIDPSSLSERKEMRSLLRVSMPSISIPACFIIFEEEEEEEGD